VNKNFQEHSQANADFYAMCLSVTFMLDQLQCNEDINSLSPFYATEAKNIYASK